MVRDATHLPADLRKLNVAGADGDEFFVDEPAASAPAAMYLPILRSGTRIGVLEIERAGCAAGWPTEERLYAVMISNLIMLLLERDAHQDAQNILEERERQLRLVTDSVPAMIAYVNTEERLEFHNCAFYQRFPQAVRPAIGRSLQEILGGPVYRRTKKRVRRALDGSEVSFRSTYRSTDGSRRIDFVKLVPHVSDSGRVLGFYALLIDVTEEWQSEEKLKDALEQMESAVHARDTFLATVSHELRTPLNAIIGFNCLMLEKDCSPEERTRYHTFARDAGQALLTQVNDLLDMAKIEAGKVELETIDFDLHLLIESAVNVSLSMAQSQGLDVGTRISEQLRRWVHGDPVRLRQILSNLLSNAMKFTEQGSILVSARAVDDRTVEIAVADTGVGIPSDRLEAIFEKFSQADISITRRFGGTGLGLAICRSLVRMMGGEISVESTLDSGSVFYITVPLQAGKACAAAVAAPPRRTRSGRILVVEDQEANAILATVLLQHMGHNVELAANGVEALHKLTQQKFDVVLMDLEMPVMGGLEATQRIRAMAMPTRNMPVIAMSASAYATDIARCSAAGMDGHIAKPIGREALATMLEHWLPERRAISRTGNAPAADSPISKLVAEVGHPAAIQVATAFESALVRRLRLFRAEKLDLPAVKIEVHNLAGISTTLGFNELTEIARKVEARFGQGGQVEELVPRLIAKCEAAEDVLRKLLHDPVAG
jgi:PAS domain S-box-containing protein